MNKQEKQEIKNVLNDIDMLIDSFILTKESEYVLINIVKKLTKLIQKEKEYGLLLVHPSGVKIYNDDEGRYDWDVFVKSKNNYLRQGNLIDSIPDLNFTHETIEDALSFAKGTTDMLIHLGEIDKDTVDFSEIEIVKEYADGHRIVKRGDRYDWQRWDDREQDHIPFLGELEYCFSSKKEAQDDYKGTMSNERLWNM